MQTTIHKVAQRPETTDAEVQMLRRELLNQNVHDRQVADFLNNIEARLVIAEGACRDAEEMFATTLSTLGYERAADTVR